jgi:hypothetical protein
MYMSGKYNNKKLLNTQQNAFWRLKLEDAADSQD